MTYEVATKMLIEVYIPEIYCSHNSFKKLKKQKPYTTSDLEYLCKYWEVDEVDSLASALDRTVTSLKKKISDLKQKGLFEYYKDLNKHW